MLDFNALEAGNEVLKARENGEITIFKEINNTFRKYNHLKSLCKNCLNHYNRMIRSKTVASCYNLLTFGYAEPLSSFFNVIFPSRSLNSAKVLRNIIGVKFSVL